MRARNNNKRHVCFAHSRRDLHVFPAKWPFQTPLLRQKYFPQRHFKTEEKEVLRLLPMAGARSWHQQDNRGDKLFHYDTNTLLALLLVPLQLALSLIILLRHIANYSPVGCSS